MGRNGNTWLIVLGLVAIAAFTLPLFASEGSQNLTLIEFLRNRRSETDE